MTDVLDEHADVLTGGNDIGNTPRVLGTPYYIAPEIILQQPHSFSVDWWAV